MNDEAIVWSLRNFRSKIGAALGDDEKPIQRIRIDEMKCSTDVFNELLDYLVQMVDQNEGLKCLWFENLIKFTAIDDSLARRYAQHCRNLEYLGFASLKGLPDRSRQSMIDMLCEVIQLSPPLEALAVHELTEKPEEAELVFEALSSSNIKNLKIINFGGNINWWNLP